MRRYKFHEMIGSETGRAFEHYIFLELMAYKNLNDKQDKISYWRTKEGYEVDFIFQEKAFEVKIVKDVTSKHIQGLLQFNKENNFKLNVICLESRKRITKINDQEIIIWLVEEFLKSLWSHSIWL